jgi:hypothetical protein
MSPLTNSHSASASDKLPSSVAPLPISVNG